MTLPGVEPSPRPTHEYEVTLWCRRPTLTQAERDEFDPIARELSFRWQQGTRGIALATEVCAPDWSNAVRQAADRLRQVWTSFEADEVETVPLSDAGDGPFSTRWVRDRYE